MTRSGHTYMPAPYEAWKRDVRTFARNAAKAVRMEGPLGLSVVFHREHIVVEIERLPGDFQNVRGDIDNLAGGLMDALQPKHGEEGIYDDDRMIKVLVARIAHYDEK